MCCWVSLTAAHSENVFMFVHSLFVRLISHQPAVLFSQNKPATNNQPTVLFSHSKSAPAISHQPNEQAAFSCEYRCCNFLLCWMLDT
jgi:hypothetical protein